MKPAASSVCAEVGRLNFLWFPLRLRSCLFLSWSFGESNGFQMCVWEVYDEEKAAVHLDGCVQSKPCYCTTGCSWIKITPIVMTVVIKESAVNIISPFYKRFLAKISLSDFDTLDLILR